ncbi:glucose-6-phosphate dehydrogenase [Nocardiopsis chromatogenes]|uniref:glucose-6-phosphate dehydrogenase n=1 Tax=Nocardiopsis chromatogenes TaxID=280239 RepID=UPI00034C984B|nr:glucose-6-phosphate dehydrogenase [Nocardiopsis chromatogenes]
MPASAPATPPPGAARSAAPTDLVVFGGTGDLAMRKLLPALLLCEKDGRLAPTTRIVAVSRDGIGDADYRGKAEAAVADNPSVLRAGAVPAPVLRRFLDRLHHVPLDLDDPGDGWDRLHALLEAAPDYPAGDGAAGEAAADGAPGAPGGRGRVYYLAMPPMLFGRICADLEAHGLAGGESRVVLEKPLGRDLESAREINDAVGAVFSERRTFRIDHYLGKETVQNLLALRFANMFLEPVWNSRWIDHVQITAAETVGVGTRHGYYDRSGAMRDMVQNHLLQLLCLIAMEPPSSFDREAVRDEKVKVLQSLAPLAGDGALHNTARGQYRAGTQGGREVTGYTGEPGADGASSTETFVALEAAVANWRWAGVPFYLRTGKRMARRYSEIVVQFRDVPHPIFPGQGTAHAPNRLVIRLQPEETIRLHMLAKEPGAGELRLRPAPLELSLSDSFAVRSPDAYERLLMDVMNGDPTLFMRRDEVEAAWRWVDPIIGAWQGTDPEPYAPGGTGPRGAHDLLARSGRAWHEGEMNR